MWKDAPVQRIHNKGCEWKSHTTHLLLPFSLFEYIDRKEHLPGSSSTKFPWLTNISAAGYQVCHCERLPLNSSMVSGSNCLTVSRPFCLASVGWSENSWVSTGHPPILPLTPIWGIAYELETLALFVTHFLAVSALGSVRHLSSWSRYSERWGLNNWLWFHAPRKALLPLLP